MSANDPKRTFAHRCGMLSHSPSSIMTRVGRILIKRLGGVARRGGFPGSEQGANRRSIQEEPMKPQYQIISAASAAAGFLVQVSLLCGALIVLGTGITPGEAVEQKGTTPYVTHFVFRPLQTIDVQGVGTVTVLEATGTTDNMKGEKMLDKMSA